MRWAGFVRAPVAGGATWTFFVGLAQGGNGGDGVRGWVDGVAVVDAWGGVAGSEVSGTVVLSGASNSYYEVVVEYKAAGAAYGCTLSWSELTVPKEVANRLASGGMFSFNEYQIRSLSSQGCLMYLCCVLYHFSSHHLNCFLQILSAPRLRKCSTKRYRQIQMLAFITRFPSLVSIRGVAQLTNT